MWIALNTIEIEQYKKARTSNRMDNTEILKSIEKSKVSYKLILGNG